MHLSKHCGSRDGNKVNKLCWDKIEFWLDISKIWLDKFSVTRELFSKKKYCLDIMSGQSEFWPDKWGKIGQWPAGNFQRNPHHSSIGPHPSTS